MDITTAQFLTSSAGRTALAELALQNITERDRLSVLSKLRTKYPPAQAGAILEQTLLRQKAARKFDKAADLFFTADGLEQASSQTVASYRAGRMVQVLPPGAKVADLACGLGSDSLAIARAGLTVTGVDLDEVRLHLARTNAATLSLSAEFVQIDLTSFDVSGYDALFFDPGRRTSGGKRIFSVENYQPPLSIIRQWLPLVPNIAVKVAPGVDYAELADYDCEVEIISEEGEVKEAVLWFGRFKSAARRATLLPDRETLIQQDPRPLIEVGPPLNYLYEPDGAVIRAGLVEELAAQMGGATRQLDRTIAYLTCAERLETPFARRFAVQEYQPWNLKKLNRRLQELGIGRVVIKKRGSPLDPQELERALKLKGQAELTLVLTKVAGQPYVLLCQPDST